MGRAPAVTQRPRPSRHYVEVVSRTTAEGTVTPLAVVWEDGRSFAIDQVLEARQAVSLRTGEPGMRFTIRVGPRRTYLWYESPRWFVEPRDCYMPQ